MTVHPASPLHRLALCAASLLIMFGGTLRLHAQERTILRLIGADSLVSHSTPEADTRDLLGHVRLEQDNVVITCDRALQNITNNTVDLEGNVVITQDTLVLRSRKGNYDGNTKTARTSDGIEIQDGHVTLHADIGWYATTPHIAEFRQRVDVRDSSTTITSQALRYERDSALATAWGNVLVHFPKERAVITGDSVIHYTKRKESFFPVQPRFWQTDTTVFRRDSLTGKADSIRLDTLYMRAQRMEAHRDSSNRFLATGDVEIVRAGLYARSDEATFLRNDSLAILRTAPIAWYEDNQLTGDSIAIRLANGHVDYVHVTGNAFSISRSKPTEKDSIGPPGRFDQTKGKIILITFRDDKAHSIRVDQTAQSLYFLYDGRDLNGVRKESGDRILISFSDGKAKEIRTIGGVEGTYFPEKYVTGREAGFNLDGFRWRDDRPVMAAYPLASAQEAQQKQPVPAPTPKTRTSKSARRVQK